MSNVITIHFDNFYVGKILNGYELFAKNVLIEKCYKIC